jgi:hypothetical protein
MNYESMQGSFNGTSKCNFVQYLVTKHAGYKCAFPLRGAGRIRAELTNHQSHLHFDFRIGQF